MTGHWPRIALASLVLLLTSCATSYSVPSSTVWGYHGTNKTGFSTVNYAPSLEACQKVRTSDMKAVNLADWTSEGFGECKPVIIKAGASGGWFAFSYRYYPGFGYALTDARICDRARRLMEVLVPQVGPTSECAPVDMTTWVLWLYQLGNTTDSHSVESVHASKAQCDKEALSYISNLISWGYSTVANAQEVMAEKGTTRRRYVCLPDTIDPRGPPGK